MNDINLDRKGWYVYQNDEFGRIISRHATLKAAEKSAKKLKFNVLISYYNGLLWSMDRYKVNNERKN